MQLHYEKRKGNNFLQVTVWQTFHIIDILVLAFCYEPVIICIQKHSTKHKKKYKKMSSFFPDLQDSPFHPLSLPPLSTFVRQLSRNTFKEDYQEIVHNNYQEILSKNTISHYFKEERIRYLKNCLTSQSWSGRYGMDRSRQQKWKSDGIPMNHLRSSGPISETDQ